MTMTDPTTSGRFGDFGGMFVPETLVPACQELEAAFRDAWGDPAFRSELDHLLKTYAGRPSPLTVCNRLSEELGCRILFKREDLNHTGSHKINNVLGQTLLAKRMGKTRIIAETGAGQHGVASATAAALFGMDCVVYMGTVDIERQKLNVFRMQLLGAEVRAAETGSQTLKDAVNEAMRYWVLPSRTPTTASARSWGRTRTRGWSEFHRVIGDESREQCAELLDGGVPDYVVACVGAAPTQRASSPGSPIPKLS